MTYRKPIRGRVPVAAITEAEIATDVAYRLALDDLMPPVPTVASWIREFLDQSRAQGLEAAFGGGFDELLEDEGDEARSLVAAMQLELAQVDGLIVDDNTCYEEAKLARQKLLHEWLDLLALAWRYRARATALPLDSELLLPTQPDVDIAGGDEDLETIAAASTEELLADVPLSERHLQLFRMHVRDSLLQRTSPVRLSSCLSIRSDSETLHLYDPTSKIVSLSGWRDAIQRHDTGTPAQPEDRPYAAESGGEMSEGQIVREHRHAIVTYMAASSVLAIDLRRPDRHSRPPTLVTSRGEHIEAEPTAAQNRFSIKTLTVDVLSDEGLRVLLKFSDGTESVFSLFAHLGADEA